MIEELIKICYDFGRSFYTVQREEIKVINEIPLEDLVAYSQIISPILAGVAIIVSWIIYLNQKKKERREKSIQIGLETESVVTLIAYINMVLELESEELVNILYSADKLKMNKFEFDEISEVYSTDELKIIEKYFSPNIYNQRRIGGAGVGVKIKTPNLIIARKRFDNLFKKNIDEIPKEDIDDFLLHEFQRMIIITLNRLETLSLMMIRKVADEKTVYDTLEDKFLQFVGMFYYYIACTNKDVSYDDKKLKEVIRMFNKWKKRAKRNIYFDKIRKKVFF